MSFWKEFKDYEDRDSDKKFLYKEGNYVTVLDGVALDLENKYGARINLTLTHKNKSKAWVQINKSVDGKMWPIYSAIKIFKLEDTLKPVLEDETSDAEKVLSALYTAIKDLVGHYLLVHVKTANNGKQYTHLKEVTTQEEYDSFNFPPMIVTKKDVTPGVVNTAPKIDDNEVLPF